MDANKKTRHQVALGLAVAVAVAGAMATLTPATQAQAFEVVNTRNQPANYSVGKSSDASTFTTESTTKTTNSTVVDKSTAGNPNKALLHCVEYGTEKVLQDVLVDYSYYGTTNEAKYKYTKPVIAGYTSAAYYADGADVYFTTKTPGQTLEFTVKYQSISADALKYSWVRENGTWFYKSGDGACQYGWNKVNGKWYFLDKTTGAMKTGWVQDGSKWYFMWSDGSMASNTVVDGYTLGSDGALVQ